MNSRDASYSTRMETRSYLPWQKERFASCPTDRAVAVQRQESDDVR